MVRETETNEEFDESIDRAIKLCLPIYNVVKLYIETVILAGTSLAIMGKSSGIGAVLLFIGLVLPSFVLPAIGSVVSLGEAFKIIRRWIQPQESRNRTILYYSFIILFGLVFLFGGIVAISELTTLISRLLP